MIYIDPGNRRADTMSIVAERCAWRDSKTGEFELVAKACGYLELVLENLAEFYDAGVIEEVPDGPGELRWTKTGHYLWNQWKNGPPRHVVELPERNPQGVEVLPRFVAAMLEDAGWTITGVRGDRLGYFVVDMYRYGGEFEPLIERVLALTAGGHTVLSLSAAEAKTLAPMLLAASL